MKKLLAILIGTVLVASAGLAIVGTVRAQIVVDGQGAEEPIPCCKLKHTISISGLSFPKDVCISEPERDTDCAVLFPGCTAIAPNPGWAGYCLIDSVATVTDWVEWIAFIITVLAIVIAGIMFITAGGNTERISTAKKMLLYSIIGVAVTVLAHLVPSVIKFFV